MSLLIFYLKKFLIILIKIYQKTLSLEHGIFKSLKPYGQCRFRPTCSDYMIQALEKHGILKGLLKGLWRLLRCNPWNRGGYDPIK